VYPNWGSALQIPELGTLDGGEPPRYRDFYFRHVGAGLFLSLRDPGSTLTFTDESLSLVGVRYVIVGKQLDKAIARVKSLGYLVVQDDALRWIFENPHPLPRAFAVAALVHADGLPHEAGRLATHAATTTDDALERDARALGIPAGAETSAGAVTMRSYHHDSIVLHASLQRPGVLVLTDSWHLNWTAKVNGSPARVGWVDIAFRGIALPTGEHDVEFSYAPRTLGIGRAVTVLTLIAFGAAIALRRRWERTLG
jgi:hypothetical protein